jgi:glycosyltransferase involved in cell wall biosynthesis
MTSPLLELSIIIPSYNEERRLPKALKEIQEYLSARSLRAEVIVVDDGSIDGTAALVENCRAQNPQLRLLSNGRNYGKGFSVRHGMLEVRGEIALFTDADLSAPIGRQTSSSQPCARTIMMWQSDRGR